MGAYAFLIETHTQFQPSYASALTEADLVWPGILTERGDPQATNSSGAKQLGASTSGVNNLVTGRLAGAAAGEHDVDGGRTSILSPEIALPAGGTTTLTFNYYMAHARTRRAPTPARHRRRRRFECDRLPGARRGQRR